MKGPQIFRNKITGYLFGKYDLEDIALDNLIHEEKYISGIEIIDYNEVMYLSIIILTISTLILSSLVSIYFLGIIVIMLYL